MENDAIYFVVALVGLLLLLNIIATYVVFHTFFEVKERKLYQTLFIWCLPFFGGIIAIYLNREDYFEQKHKKQIGNQTSITDSDATTHYIAGNDHGGR